MFPNSLVNKSCFIHVVLYQMYTANTMAMAAEVMGMTLSGSSPFPVESEEKLSECQSVGPTMFNLLKKNILPWDTMTCQAFENALVSVILCIE